MPTKGNLGQDPNSQESARDTQSYISNLVVIPVEEGINPAQITLSNNPQFQDYVLITNPEGITYKATVGSLSGDISGALAIFARSTNGTIQQMAPSSYDPITREMYLQIDGIPQVQSNWDELGVNDPSYIRNKPTIPAAQVQSDWTQVNSGAVDYIKNKPPAATQQQVLSADPLANKEAVTPSLMNFQQQGAGAVLYPLVSKMQQIVSVKDFGAVGDGVADDTVAIQAAVNSGAKVINLLSNGIYKVTSKIELPNNITINGNSGVINSQGATLAGGTGILTIDGGGSNTQKENINLMNIQFVGKVTFDEHRHQIAIHGGKNIKITGCYFNGFPGDAVYINGGDGYQAERHNYNISIVGNLFDGVNYANRNGVSVLDCNGLLIEGNTFTRCSQNNMPGAIDLEPNPPTDAYSIIKNIVVTNNTFYLNKGSNGDIVIALSSGMVNEPTNIIVSNNVSNTSNIYGQFMTIQATVSNPNSKFLSVINNLSNGLIGIVAQSNSATTLTNFEMVGNEIVNLSTNVNPITIQNSIIQNNILKSIDLPVTTTLINVTVSNNKISEYLRIMNSSYIIVDGNQVNQLNYPPNLYRPIYVSGSNLSIINNQTKNTTSTRSIVTASPSPSTVVFLNNQIDIVSQVPAFINDDCDGVVNGAAGDVPTFNTDTFPEVFPSGVSVAMIDGDPNTPSITRMGVLETRKASSSKGSYITAVYQSFSPGYVSGTPGKIWYRQATSLTTWSAWW